MHTIVDEERNLKQTEGLITAFDEVRRLSRGAFRREQCAVDHIVTSSSVTAAVLLRCTAAAPQIGGAVTSAWCERKPYSSQYLKITPALNCAVVHHQKRREVLRARVIEKNIQQYLPKPRTEQTSPPRAKPSEKNSRANDGKRPWMSILTAVRRSALRLPVASGDMAHPEGELQCPHVVSSSCALPCSLPQGEVSPSLITVQQQ